MRKFPAFPLHELNFRQLPIDVLLDSIVRNDGYASALDRIPGSWFPYASNIVGAVAVYESAKPCNLLRPRCEERPEHSWSTLTWFDRFSWQTGC
jgi:hypothetical protein